MGLELAEAEAAGRPQAYLVALSTLGLLVAAALLGRFTFDLGGSVAPVVSVPFALLVGAALSGWALGLRGTARVGGDGSAMGGAGPGGRLALAAAVPLGFVATSLDCTGLASAGCTSFCTFLKLGGYPLAAVGAAAFLAWGSRWILVALAAASFVPLVPHCVCRNPANEWWIDRLGASPACAVWGFTASLIALTALARGQRPGIALAVVYAIVGGALAFFAGHHYLGYPW